VLQTGPLPAVCLVHGDDTLLVERAVAAARSRLETAGPMALRTVWGDDAPDGIVDTLATYASPTLFGGVTLLVVRRAESLRGRAEQQVIDLAERPPPMGHLLVVATTVDRRRKLFAALLKTLAIACDHPVDRADQARWLRVLAAERGIRLAAAAGEYLLQNHGGDLAVLASELDKVAAATAGRTADRDTVRELTVGSRAHRVDELTESLGQADHAGAVRALRGLLADGEPPLKVVAFVAANVRRSLQVAELAEAGLGPDQIAARLRLPAWLVSRQRGRGSARVLEEMLQELSVLDGLLKRSRPPLAVFEAALWRVLRKPSRRRAG
jgi:DNA polymerase-3 subunit delta